ncbi:plastid movement impaired 1-related 1 protein [Tanacetum coccineum]
MKDTRPQRYDVGEPDPEYVSLEDLTTLAMNKIEALSVEGLRIQSGMSDKDAPSNISPQSIGEISALKVALAAALDIRPLDKRNKVAIRGYYKRWSSCRCISSIKYFLPTLGPAQHVSSDGSPFSSLGLSSDRIGRIWIFFKLRDLEEMQNLLTEFYLAFLESLSSASLCSTQKLIEADGSSNVCLSTAQPYVVGGLHELLSSCDGKNTRLLPSLVCLKGLTVFKVFKERVSNAQRDLSDSGKRKVKAYIGSAAFQTCSALCHEM